MRRIIEVSNEASPGTKENWYEVYIDGKDEFVSGGGHVATFHTKKDLYVYITGLRQEQDNCEQRKGEDYEDFLKRYDASEFNYKLIPYESNE